nr:hypothetical protein [Rugamonas sp. CCM 8940]
MLVAVLGLGAAALLISAVSRWNLRAGHERRTLAALGQAQDALIGFAILHGRLPRPAVSASDGRESGLPCTSEQSCTGFLPWVSLGVERADGWGHLLRYSAAPAFTSAPIDFTTAVASKTLQSRRDGELVYVAGFPLCQRSAQCLPAVVLSTGKEGFGVSEQGVAQLDGSATNLDERRNAETGHAFIRRPASAAAADAGGEFDDLLSTVPLLTLINRINAVP